MSHPDLAARLALARRDARALADDPSASITTVADAYAVQSEIAALTQGDIRGWKVTALTPADQAKYGANRPVAGPLLAPYVSMSPSKLALGQFVTPLLECEIAFVLGADLPPRTEPYDRREIEASVEAVVPGMEVVDSRVFTSATELARLADSMMNGAYVVGAPVAAWRGIDLDKFAVELSADNGERQRGSSARIPGNPFGAVLALANAQPLAGGLKKGHVITTGTCTPPVPMRKGNYLGDFGQLGQVRLSIV